MLGYRSFVTVDGDREHVVRRSLEQLHAWLREKRYDADALKVGEACPLGEDVDGTLVERRTQDGAHWMRATIVERSATGRWTTELTVGVPGRVDQPPWVWLDIYSPEPGEGRRQPYTAIPRLARRLAEVFPVRDGRAGLGPEPTRVFDDNIDELVEIVKDPDRRGLVFVAGSGDEVPFGQWADHVSKLLKDTVGMAAAYQLDPRATLAFNVRIGASHAVAPFTVRTFRPGADPSSPADGLQQRVLGLARIVSDDDRALARLLGRRARETAIQTPLPASVLRVNRFLEQQINDVLVAGLVVSQEPDVPAVEVVAARDVPVSGEPTSRATSDVTERVVGGAEIHLALAATARELFGAAEVTADLVSRLGRWAQAGLQAESRQAVIAERLAALGEHVDELTATRDHLRARLEEEQLDHAETAEERQRAEEQVRHLRKLVVASDRRDEAWNEPEPDSRPSSYSELLELVGTFDRVWFTGSRQVTLDLEDHDPLFTWGGKIWEALCALEDYGRVSADGQCARSVDGYLRALPEGCRGYSVNRHARDESTDVHKNPKFQRARMLPVPQEVDPDGEVFMGAHFKITQSGLISPRVHYYDDTARTGRVYVGHIGPHLPTKKTN